MVAPVVVAAGMNLLGGLLGGRSAQKAAQAKSESDLQVAKIAAESAKFKPFSLTTGFGKSFFDEDKQTA